MYMYMHVQVHTCIRVLVHAGIVSTDWVKAKRVGVSTLGSLAWEDGEMVLSSTQHRTVGVAIERTALRDAIHWTVQQHIQCKCYIMYMYIC